MGTEKKIAAIISGGNINYDFALSFLEKHPVTCLIGADRGIEFLKRAEMVPDYIVGDFDSAGSETLSHFRKKGVEIRAFKPEKDDTDTQIAVNLAMEKGNTCIYILGGTGSRLDHVLGNIQILGQTAEAGIECYLIDEHNRIRVINNKISIKKAEQYGNFVSIVAHTTEVKGLDLVGFYYPLSNYTMSCNQALGLSNEIIAEEAFISVTEGALIVIESRD